ncbi:MAG TPA: isochorismatase family protein [Sedimentisphaerales bacterium]|nr:isochorismatase family protein [Sedimentisphaerales bacterium]
MIDVDTQRDFLVAEGAACVRNHRRVLSNIRRVAAWARHNHIRVISTVQIYANNGNKMKYCIDGTEGLKKIAYTLRKDRHVFAADGNTDLPRDVMRMYEQVIFGKRCIDPFEEPRIERFFSEINSEEFLVIGAGTEKSVKATVLGLLQRGKRVTVIIDATGIHDRNEADLAIRQMQAKGARLMETRDLAGTTHLRNVGACNCDRCRGLTRKDHSEATAENQASE